MPIHLLIARHGQTAWNAAGKLQGGTDIPLDDQGREQARSLAAALGEEPIAQIWASDLARAHETATIIAAARKLPPVNIDAGLRERAFGVFEGLTRDECAVHHPEAWQEWMTSFRTPPGGEPLSLAVNRMTRALRAIAARSQPDTHVLIVSHGGLMRLWLRDELRQEVAPITNGAVHRVRYDGTRFLR